MSQLTLYSLDCTALQIQILFNCFKSTTIKVYGSIKYIFHIAQVEHNCRCRAQLSYMEFPAWLNFDLVFSYAKTRSLEGTNTPYFRLPVETWQAFNCPCNAILEYFIYWSIYMDIMYVCGHSTQPDRKHKRSIQKELKHKREQHN